MKKAALTVLALIFTVCLLTACEIKLPENYVNTYPFSEKYSVGNAEIHEEVKILNVDWMSGKITVLPSDNEKISFTETCSKTLTDDTSLHYLIEDGKLNIKFAKSGFKLSNIAPKELTIYLPEDLCLETLSINSASAKSKISIKNIETLSVDTASGTVEAYVENANKIDIDSASGDAIITSNGNINIFNADTASGKVDISAKSVQKIDIDSASGKSVCSLLEMPDSINVDSASGTVKLSIPENASFSVDFDSLSGIFECEFETIRQNKKFVFNGGRSNINVNTASGDLIIKKIVALSDQ